MHKRSLASVLATGMVLASTGVYGADFGVGVKGGTLGAGVELGMTLTDSVNARVAFNSFSHDDDRTEDGINYETELDLRSSALLFDWHPFKGVFRVTAGYVFSDNELEMDASLDAGETYEIGDVTYTAAQIGTLSGTVDMGSGPYLGVGWGNVPAKGFGFSFDIGVVQQGEPDVSLRATGAVAAADIDEEEDNLRDDLSEFDLYPVVSLGVTYGF